MTATLAAETCSSVPFDLPAFADTAVVTLKGYKAPTIKRFVGNGGVSFYCCNTNVFLMHEKFERL
jgi:hypothetical protein